MPHALVHPDHGTVLEVITGRKPFAVARPLRWIICPADVTTRHRFEGGAFVPPAAEPEAEPDPINQRLAAIEVRAQRLEERLDRADSQAVELAGLAPRIARAKQRVMQAENLAHRIDWVNGELEQFDQQALERALNAIAQAEALGGRIAAVEAALDRLQEHVPRIEQAARRVEQVEALEDRTRLGITAKRLEERIRRLEAGRR